MIHSILIMNRYGGLIYHRNFTSKLNHLSSNECIIFTSSLHGVMMISAQLSPVPGSGGLSLVLTDNFNIFCSESATGMKIIILSEPDIISMSDMFYRIQILFSEYVNTNPFYQPDMPIKIDTFDTNLYDEVSRFNSTRM